MKRRTILCQWKYLLPRRKFNIDDLVKGSPSIQHPDDPIGIQIFLLSKVTHIKHLGCFTLLARLEGPWYPFFDKLRRDCISVTIYWRLLLGTFRTNSWEVNFSKTEFFETYFLELTDKTFNILLVFGVLDFLQKIGASIFKGLILRFWVKVISNDF